MTQPQALDLMLPEQERRRHEAGISHMFSLWRIHNLIIYRHVPLQNNGWMNPIPGDRLMLAPSCACSSTVANKRRQAVVAWLSFAILLCTASASMAAHAADPASVTLAQGSLAGSRPGGLQVFKNIPYA